MQTIAKRAWHRLRTLAPEYALYPLIVLIVLLVMGAFTGRFLTTDNPYGSYTIQARLGVVPGADDVLHAFADGGRCGAARQKRLGAGVVGVRSWVPTDGGAVSSAAGVSAQ